MGRPTAEEARWRPGVPTPPPPPVQTTEKFQKVAETPPRGVLDKGIVWTKGGVLVLGPRSPFCGSVGRTAPSETSASGVLNQTVRGMRGHRRGRSRGTCVDLGDKDVHKERDPAGEHGRNNCTSDGGVVVVVD